MGLALVFIYHLASRHTENSEKLHIVFFEVL